MTNRTHNGRTGTQHKQVSSRTLASFALLAIVLVGLTPAIPVSAVEQLQVSENNPSENNRSTGDFTVGFRVQGVNIANRTSIDRILDRLQQFQAELSKALKAEIPSFKTLDLVSTEGDAETPVHTLYFIARFTKSESLERVAAVIAPVLQKLTGMAVSVSMKRNGNKLTEE